MIDPKLNESQTNIDTDLEEVPEETSWEGREGPRKRRGLSINDTIASNSSLSVGSRGVDTSGIETGAGAGSGLTRTTPGEAGESPAPNIVPGARGSGMTPRGDSTSGQNATLRLDANTAPSHEEIAARAYRCWQERGCPEGSADVDWCRAEEELRQERAQQKSSAAASGSSR